MKGRWGSQWLIPGPSLFQRRQNNMDYYGVGGWAKKYDLRVNERDTCVRRIEKRWWKVKCQWVTRWKERQQLPARQSAADVSSIKQLHVFPMQGLLPC